MILDLQCQSLAERTFRKLDTVDWNKYAQEVSTIEQNQTENVRNTTVTYANGLNVSTYEERVSATAPFRGRRIQYSFPVEVNGENYQVVANNAFEGYNTDAGYSFTLLKGGEMIAQASGDDCTSMEITADETGAQLLNAALSTITGLDAHITETKYVLRANN